MSNYRLDKHPNEYYLSFLREENIRLIPYIERGIYLMTDEGLVKTDVYTDKTIYIDETEAYAEIEIGEGDDAFDVHIHTPRGHLEPELFEKARSVLGQIVDMDRQAREVPSDTDYGEFLDFIAISHEVVNFHYVSSVVNTSWYARFKKAEDGRWVFKEIGIA